jgi:pimeloyl-CoA synthetase
MVRSTGIRQSEIKRAIKAVMESGLNVEKVEVDHERVTIFSVNSSVNQSSPLQIWRRNNGDR